MYALFDKLGLGAANGAIKEWEHQKKSDVVSLGIAGLQPYDYEVLTREKVFEVFK